MFTAIEEVRKNMFLKFFSATVKLTQTRHAMRLSMIIRLRFAHATMDLPHRYALNEF
jgi:hypothetical protein